MMVLVRELLHHPGEYTLQPKTFCELLSRLYELLTYETTKRPSHRPKEKTGAFVATLIESRASRAKAIRIVAKAEGKTEAAVARAYERHQKAKRQKLLS